MSNNSTNNVTGYIGYFRSLAVANQMLKHDPASETGDSAPGTKHFLKIDVQDVLSALQTKMGWPALFVELYETVTKSEMLLDIKLNPRGAFMVLDHPKAATITAQLVCYSNAETIVYDLLKQIWQDHYANGVDYCTAPFAEFNFDKIQIVPVGPLFDGEYGYRVEFGCQFQQAINIAEPPASGAFIFP